MNILTTFFSILTLVVCTLLYNLLQKTALDLIEVKKCPYCFGTTLCKEFVKGEVAIRSSSLLEIFTNYFSVKNVFYGEYKNNNVVLKKMGHNWELYNLDVYICKNNNLNENCDLDSIRGDVINYKERVVEYLKLYDPHVEKHFRICSERAVKKFVELVLSKKPANTSEEEFFKNIWTVMQLNIEPVLLQVS